MPTSVFVFTYKSEAPWIGKEDIQLFLFADSMIICVGYLMEFTKKKPLKLINKFIKDVTSTLKSQWYTITKNQN